MNATCRPSARRRTTIFWWWQPIPAPDQSSSTRSRIDGCLRNARAANTFARIDSFYVSSGASFGLSNAGATNANLYLSVGSLSGLGAISIGAAVGGNVPAATGNTVYLNVANASSFSGQIKWGSSVNSNVTLNFEGDFTSMASLLARSNDRITLDQNLTFESVVLGTTWNLFNDVV